MIGAFPGLRQLREWTGSEAWGRIEILLSEPLQFRRQGPGGGSSVPIWRLYAQSSMPVEKYERVDSNIFRLGFERFCLGSIWAYRGRSSRADFVVFEALPEARTGLYADDCSDAEEYGVTPMGELIRREEFDDGSVVRGGVVYPMPLGTRLELRFVRRTWVILTGQNSRLHDLELDLQRRRLLEGLCSGSAQLEELVSLAEGNVRSPG